VCHSVLLPVFCHCIQGLTSLQVMDKVICECAKRGIKVILDYHRMHLTWGNEIGTWWDKDTPSPCGLTTGRCWRRDTGAYPPSLG